VTPDEEAAALCSIALTALMYLPRECRVALIWETAGPVSEIARLRNCTPEDIQNDFERRATS